MGRIFRLLHEKVSFVYIKYASVGGGRGKKSKINKLGCSFLTSYSAYVATEIELVGAKVDGLLPSNFL